MNHPPCHIANLIAKHRKGTCSPSELEELYHWLQSGQSQQELEAFLNDRVNSDDDQRDEETEKQALRLVFSKLRAQINGTNQPRSIVRDADSSPVWRSFFAQAGRVAAGIALVTGLTAIAYYFLSSPALPTKTVANSWVNKASESGQKLSLTLPDGSRVKLNSQSSIAYWSDFLADSVRYVQLTGEAFFEVTKSDKPFVVEINGVKTRVLGTAFNIKENPNNKLEIALVHGKVQVEKGSERVVLLPNEMAVINKNENIQKLNYREQEILGWKDGVLYLKAENFEEIIPKLEAWYGVEIEVEGSIEYKGIEVHYQNETLANVLKGLSYITYFEYKITQNKVFIKSTRRHAYE